MWIRALTSPESTLLGACGHRGGDGWLEPLVIRYVEGPGMGQAGETQCVSDGAG